MQSQGVRTYRNKPGSIDLRIPRRFLDVLILIGYGSVLVSAPAVVGSPSSRGGLAQDSAKPDAPSVVKESPKTIRLTQEVLQEAVQLQKKYPNRIDPIYLQGMTYFRMGNSTEAEKHWRKCLEMNPQYAVAYTSLAGIKADKSKYEEALALYQKGLLLFPNDPQVITNIGVSLIYLSRFDEAIKILTENIAKYPREMRAHIYLGQAYQQRKEYEKAKFHFEKALPVFPDNKKIYYGLARIYARLGEKDKATEARKKFSELSSRHIEQKLERRYEHYDDYDLLTKNIAEIYVQFGTCYQIYGDTKEAERLWKKSAAHDAQNTECRRMLAVLYQKTNRNRDALTLYQELCKLDPKNPGYFLHRGALSAQFGDTRSAESAFQTVIQLAPGHPEGYRSLIMLYIQTNQKPQEAKKLATTLVQKSPTALDNFLLARVCVRRGEYPQARRALEKAIDLDPKNEMYKMLYQEIQR
jgi:tetratricopeptide (TPR) repeat protein